MSTDTASEPTKPTNPHAEAYAAFLDATEKHRIVVVQDSGLNRTLHVGAPGTGMWSWTVITWPGYLATVGDVADGYTFTRVEDMVTFFEQGARNQDYYSDGAPSIDVRYWAEKLAGGRSTDVRIHSEKAFLSYVQTVLDENDEVGLEAQKEYRTDREAFVEDSKYPGQTVHLDPDVSRVDAELAKIQAIREEVMEGAKEVAGSADLALEWCYGNERSDWFPDPWDHSWTEYDPHFLFTCYAIELTVRLYRAHQAEHPSPDDFVLVEGGAVQNEPALPVYDLDVLESTDEQGAAEALQLWARIERHLRRQHAPSAALVESLDRLGEMVDEHGDDEAKEELADLRSKRAAFLALPYRER